MPTYAVTPKLNRNHRKSNAVLDRFVVTLPAASRVGPTLSCNRVGFVNATVRCRRSLPISTVSFARFDLTRNRTTLIRAHLSEENSLLRKNISAVLSLSFILAISTSIAYPQQAASGRKVSADQVADDTVQLMRQDIRSERKKMVAANLPLTGPRPSSSGRCMTYTSLNTPRSMTSATPCLSSTRKTTTR